MDILDMLDSLILPSIIVIVFGVAFEATSALINVIGALL